METVESNPTTFSDLEILELELELAARRVEEARRLAAEPQALPRVPASYFEPGKNGEIDEDEWWAKQFGSREPVPPPARPTTPPRRILLPDPSIWGWK